MADKLLSGLKPAVFASLAHEGNDGERWDLGDLVSRLEAWLTIRAGDDPAGSLPQPLNGPPASCSEEDTYVALFERLELLHDFALGLLRTELDRFQRDTAAADTAAEECQRRQVRVDKGSTPWASGASCVLIAPGLRPRTRTPRRV